MDDKLSLTELAKATEIRSHTLSQVINQSMNTNFYKLINSYRVQHTVMLIDDTELHWPLERIALESGFSNRVTFVKAFKEVMQCTPSAYKKHNKQQKSGSAWKVIEAIEMLCSFDTTFGFNPKIQYLPKSLVSCRQWFQIHQISFFYRQMALIQGCNLSSFDLPWRFSNHCLSPLLMAK